MKHRQAMEERASSAAAALLVAQRQESMRVDSQDRIRSGLAELGINIPEGSSSAPVIETALEENASKLEALAEVGLRGEALALSLAKTGQLARQAELEQEVQRLRHDLSRVRDEIKMRQATGELVL